jgi:murein L,D-transpeptidase YafK
MKLSFVVSCSLILLFAFTIPNDFLADQKKIQRVSDAIGEKQDFLQNQLKKNGLELENLNVLLVAFKEEKELEVYAKKKEDLTYQKISTYDVCASSGQLGPKRKQGDYQVPEGFYYIDRFNPTSAFHLSLGINYPNTSDRRKSTASNLGGDIFIHGSCVTIGCLPLTDDKIKEMYLYAVYAKNKGQTKIPVYIFPFRMSEEKLIAHEYLYKENPVLEGFWSNLKRGHDKFQTNKKELMISFEQNGDYKF